MGTAISEYYHTGKAKKLTVSSSYFDDDEMPVPHLFRTWDKMPEIEKKALQLAKGKILDVGAGAGCHSLVLQQNGLDVTAIDISQLSCNVMSSRGIQKVQCVDLFDKSLEGPFDTILMMMNGIGIVGKIKRLPAFFERIQELLAPGGTLLLDSSDLSYLYEDEEGIIELPSDEYFGEVDFRMKYKGIKGESFDWLYIDFPTLAEAASQASFLCEKVLDGKHYEYLASCQKK